MVSNRRQGTKGVMFDDTPMGILEALFVAGGISIALSTAPALFVALASLGYVFKAEDRARRRKLQQSFDYLKRHKYVAIKNSSQRTTGSVITNEGYKRLKRLLMRRALASPIERHKKWDGKWRLILFDIPASERAKRNAFRSLIRRIGAVMLQKSVWVYPYDCSEHISLLRQFFDLPEDALRLVEAGAIGDDRALRKHFKI
ncbi:MAG: CRISPR-associated endonuclease Cas2 [Patescibacteria group bacterium]